MDNTSEEEKQYTYQECLMEEGIYTFADYPSYESSFQAIFMSRDQMIEAIKAHNIILLVIRNGSEKLHTLEGIVINTSGLGPNSQGSQKIVMVSQDKIEAGNTPNFIKFTYHKKKHLDLHIQLKLKE
jgi:hypothetical protein